MWRQEKEGSKAWQIMACLMALCGVSPFGAIRPQDACSIAAITVRVGEQWSEGVPPRKKSSLPATVWMFSFFLDFFLPFALLSVLVLFGHCLAQCLPKQL